jgi:hypothetical protein
LAGAGPTTTLAPLSSTGCPVATDLAQARAAHDRATSPSPTPSSTATSPVSSFPVGVYTTFVTRDQWKAGDVTSNLSTADVTFTTTFRADGTVTQVVDPVLSGQGPLEGTWRVAGDRLVLDIHGVDDPSDRYVETTRWSYLKGELRFVAVDVLDTASQVMYQQPWRKVG